ncbi:NADH-quinone oxidoreductase subunit C [Jiulongibacter sp. NS-SX5]|uniref:NADH-quinone oxidoreductase subunit C n=1 Tax=Jiulongibacter sp. NS-SX5 TaxID=3463854 RepID=UPI00405996B4
MNFANFENIVSALQQQFPEEAFEAYYAEVKQPYVQLNKDYLFKVCEYLHTTPELYFDFLNCITASDNGPNDGTLELIYHLSSIPLEHSFIIKVVLPRGTEDNLPEVDSLVSIWKTADWHEREAYDLVGVTFKNHPDLRRVLLPADWKGHPLRKDHEEQEKYHGIKIKY